MTIPFECALVGLVGRVAIPHTLRTGVPIVIYIDADNFAGVRSGAACGRLEVRSSGREMLAN